MREARQKSSLVLASSKNVVHTHGICERKESPVLFSRLCCLRVVCLEVARPDVIVRVYLITHEDRLDAETYGVMTLENRMATFFNSQVWCSMKPLSITRARNTVQLPYQLPVLEPLYSRQTCQSPHALAMLSPLSSPSRNTAASPSGRTSLHKRPSLHNWHERRVSTVD
jgi:hypothetical protein